MVLLKTDMEYIPSNCLRCPFSEEQDSCNLYIYCSPMGRELTEKHWNDTMNFYDVVSRPEWCPLIETSVKRK